MALHPCPRCKRLVPVGVSYCEACRPEAEAQAQEAIERRYYVGELLRTVERQIA